MEGTKSWCFFVYYHYFEDIVQEENEKKQICVCLVIVRMRLDEQLLSEW